MDISKIEGKQTIESISKILGIKKGSAINLVSKLKKKNKVIVNGGGKQKRIYTISMLPIQKSNGFFDIVNKYSKIKLVPKFYHKVHGTYTIEHAIIDGIMIGDSRTIEATSYLFKRIANWKMLFDLAKQKNVTEKVYELYFKAKKQFRCRTMPKKYLKKAKKKSKEKISK